MALTVWTQASKYSFGTFQERVKVHPALDLPVTNDAGVVYSIISGALPGGLQLQGNKIVGTPFEVSRVTEFSFCIRAARDLQISDRTFKMSIDGADQPEFITSAGKLNIGTNQQLYAMDSSYIDYQIEAIDQDTAAGQHLSYFIASENGRLPPGLVLTDDGRIVGFVQPLLATRAEDGDGTYDNSYFDVVGYDFALRSTNGYDSYVYDTVFFDYSLPSTRPRKLNRNYEFIVTVTDGDSVVNRTFKIFVVGDDYFRADNTGYGGLFTADVTYLRKPIWLTRSELGTYRANNYITVLLDIYNDGPVSYSIDNIANLPPGMNFDFQNGEIFGRVPYQPAVTRTYPFTVTATRIGDTGEVAETSRTFVIRIIGEVDSVIVWGTDPNLGVINANFISTLSVRATSTIIDAILLYSLTGGKLPPGLSLDASGEIVGKVNQYGTYNTAGLTSFDKLILGPDNNFLMIENNIILITEDGNRILNESTSVSNANTPSLPITNTTFDQGTTTVDRVYRFNVTARDQYGYSAISREFTITIEMLNELVYSNIITRPFLSLPQRAAWKNFINDTSVFTPASIYRPNDANFGIQIDLSMLVYAGVETTESAKYISAMGLNHKRKRFHFGSVAQAVAVTTGTREEVYEVIYIEMRDPLEPNGKRLSSKLSNLGLQPEAILVDNSTSIWSRRIDELIINAPTASRPDPIVTVDSTGYQVSNAKTNTYFPNSISNWRDRLKSVGKTERNYLPLWMRSIQPGQRQELGFTLAVPLCYCKVGTAADIILNIKYSGFDFKTLDYTADRYIIDSVEGETGDKYLVFRNDKITV
jgi:hypothetical protein